MKLLFVFISLVFALQLGELSTQSLNTSWASPYAPPRYYQVNRGTCWAFATIGILEESYRQNGVEKGYLEPNQYVRFSEQAFGVSMIEQCAKHPEVCNDLGDFVVDGSTEGGETYWLYLFPEMYNKVLPVSVCEYPEEDSPETDKKCDGYEQALKTNPINFKITKMTQTYNAMDTREFLLNNKKSMAFNVFIHDSFFYFPCADTLWATHDLCSADKRKRCPTDKNYNSEYCAVIISPMYNPDGEFFAHGNIYPDGGHAMNVVGFNDDFMTKAGSKGGFIIKNSWKDKAYLDARTSRGVRGSHSIQFWMQKISHWDERKICANAENPTQWVSCVSQDAGPTTARQKQLKLMKNIDYLNRNINHSNLPRNKHGEIDASAFDISQTCLDDKFLTELVEVYYTPSEFECVDEHYCSKDPKYRYFLIDMIRSVDNWMLQVNMMQYNIQTKEQTTIELPYLFDGLIAFVFTPIQSQKDILVNDYNEDLCGYYFWPYDLLDRQVGLFGGFSTVAYDIEWDDKSYLANAAKCPACDYSLLRSSSGEQRQFSPYSTNPWNTQRYDV